MKAIQVHQFGGPEVLAVHEVPTPKARARRSARARACRGRQSVRYLHAQRCIPGETRAALYSRLRRGGHDRGRRRGRHQSKTGDRVYTATTLTRRLCRICAGARRTRSTRCPKKSRSRRARALGALRNWLYGLAPPTPMRALAKHCSITAQRRRGASRGAVGACFGIDRDRHGWNIARPELAKKEGAHHVFDHTKRAILKTSLKPPAAAVSISILECWPT